MKVEPTRTIESDSYSVGSDPGLPYLPLVIAEVATVKENGDKEYRVSQKKLSLVEISCGKYNSGWWEIH